jgi:hypothetical protein
MGVSGRIADIPKGPEWRVRAESTAEHVAQSVTRPRQPCKSIVTHCNPHTKASQRQFFERPLQHSSPRLRLLDEIFATTRRSSRPCRWCSCEWLHRGEGVAHRGMLGGISRDPGKWQNSRISQDDQDINSHQPYVVLFGNSAPTSLNVFRSCSEFKVRRAFPSSG